MPKGAILLNTQLDKLLEILQDKNHAYSEPQKVQAINDLIDLYVAHSAQLTKDDIYRTLDALANKIELNSSLSDETRIKSQDAVITVIYYCIERMGEREENVILQSSANLISDSSTTDGLRSSTLALLDNTLGYIQHPLSSLQLNAFLPAVTAIPANPNENGDFVSAAMQLLVNLEANHGSREELGEASARMIFEASCHALHNFLFIPQICDNSAILIERFFSGDYATFTHNDTQNGMDGLLNMLHYGNGSSVLAAAGLEAIYRYRSPIENADNQRVLDALDAYDARGGDPQYKLELISCLCDPAGTGQPLLGADDIAHIVTLIENNGSLPEFTTIVIYLSEPRQLQSDQIERLLTALHSQLGQDVEQDKLIKLNLLALLCLEPSRMDESDFSSIFEMDAALLQKMVDKASDWPSHVLLDGEPPYFTNRYTLHYADDLQAIVSLAQDHLGERRAEMLYNGAGWTYLSAHTPQYFDFLYHFLNNEIDVSRYGLSRLLEVYTTRGDIFSNTAFDAAFVEHGGRAQNNYADGEIFFLSIQPGNTEESQRIHDWMAAHITENGAPFLSAQLFPMFMHSMHGSGSALLMKTQKLDAPQEDFDYSKYLISLDNPDYIRSFGQGWIAPPSPNFQNGYAIGVDNACGENENKIAQLIANNVPAVIIAATQSAVPLAHLPFKKVRDRNGKEYWTLQLLETPGNYSDLTDPKVFYPQATDVESNLLSSENRTDLIYPNPCRDHINIPFHLKKEGRLTIEIFNSMGERVAVPMENVPRPASDEYILFETNALARGTYFVRLTLDGEPLSDPLPFVKN